MISKCLRKFSARRILFSPFFYQLSSPINYIDIGARDGLGEPWVSFPDNLLCVSGFEPDPHEHNNLVEKYPSYRIYPYALGATNEVRPFYQCQWGSTSSMYQPNILGNSAFLGIHWDGREIAQEYPVECVSLDSLLEGELIPDFIKIDTQGSELDILKGARSTLESSSPFILVETWCIDVYSKAPLFHEVFSCLQGLGYDLFDLNIAASWKYQTEMMSSVRAKGRTIGFDLLFCKAPRALRFSTDVQIVKFLAICELYGFRDYACYVAALPQYSDIPLVQRARSLMLANNRHEHSLPCKISRKLASYLSRDSREWPTLH